MGDKDENGKGDFVLIDSKTLKVTGEFVRWFVRNTTKGRSDVEDDLRAIKDFYVRNCLFFACK